MELKLIWIRSGALGKKECRTFPIMRMLLLLFFFFSVAAPAQEPVGRISLSLQNAPLEEALKEIKRQTGITVIYTREQLSKASPVSVNLRAATLRQALEACFKNQPFSYIIDGNLVAVKDKVSEPSPQRMNTLTGTVRDENGKPIAGASVQVKRSEKGTTSDERGNFSFTGLEEGAVLVISSIGFYPKEVVTRGQEYLAITLQLAVTPLDETVVIAYGTTTRRLNTGSVGRVTAREIAMQPVSNPLAALHGRVPGVLITQSSGVAGSSITIQVRGQNSVGGYANAPYPVGNDPLYIVDGIPYNPGSKLNELLNASTTPGDARSGGLSPLNLINPSDIESIEILKDADATAIYGSRGANGVVLITTKKGRAGKPKLDVNVYTGISRPTRMVEFLSTADYLQMRREAFRNDGVIPTVTNAPDLLLYDTAAYTNFKELFYGRSGRSLDAQLSYSGGNAQTQFSIGGGYHREQSLLPGNFIDQRPSVRLQLNHQSVDQRLKLGFSANFSANKNTLSNRDLTQYIASLPPNFPPLLTADGSLSWSFRGVSHSNPLAYTFQPYESKADNLLSQFAVTFDAFKTLQLKLSAGFNSIGVDETSLVPKIAQNPQNNPTGNAEFAVRKTRSWVLEPHAEYKRTIGGGHLSVLFGATAQETLNQGSYIIGTNYSSDAVLNSISNAGNITASSTYAQYRYLGLFGKVNYNWKGKYILSATGRRDGSSRFGTGNQFSNFGAIGGAWIFSKEKGVQRQVPVLSFGKIRSSYGLTGNDQIGDYIYLDTWTPSTNNYGGLPGFRPSGLFNPDFAWELNRKFELALDLGFWKDRLLFSVAYYNNQSSNQLISYRLPTQTGFSGLRAKNIPALVQNTGLEFSLSAEVIRSRWLHWSTSLNMTIPRNKLLAFPDLAASSYANVYVVGQSLSVVRGFHYLGVDPQTGIYLFEDVNGDNVWNSADYRVIGNLIPSYYGGLSNSLSYRGVKFDCFLEFRRQAGRDIAYYQNNAYPGGASNQPQSVLQRWQKPGDITTVQKFTATAGTPAYTAAFRYMTSDGVLTDASYLRLKNVALSYQLPEAALQRLHLQGASIYIHAQNLLTFTSFPGDPETGNYKVLPPLKVLTVGIRLTL